jgi:hypothetical protein
MEKSSLIKIDQTCLALASAGFVFAAWSNLNPLLQAALFFTAIGFASSLAVWALRQDYRKFWPMWLACMVFACAAVAFWFAWAVSLTGLIGVGV